MSDNPFKPRLDMLPSRILTQIDNKLHPRAVVSWKLTGGHITPQGQKIPGSTILALEGGGIVWYPQTTILEQALDDADDLGYNTTAVRAKLADWAHTGLGATFHLR